MEVFANGRGLDASLKRKKKKKRTASKSAFREPLNLRSIFMTSTIAVRCALDGCFKSRSRDPLGSQRNAEHDSCRQFRRPFLLLGGIISGFDDWSLGRVQLAALSSSRHPFALSRGDRRSGSDTSSSSSRDELLLLFTTHHQQSTTSVISPSLLLGPNLCHISAPWQSTVVRTHAASHSKTTRARNASLR